MFRRSGRASGAMRATRQLAAIVTITLTTTLPSRLRAAEDVRAVEAPVAPVPAAPVMGAATPVGSTLALSIEDAARRAAEASPVARRAKAQRISTEARYVEAGMMLPANPAVAVSVGPTRDQFNGLTRTQTGLADLSALFGQPAGEIVFTWCAASAARRDARMSRLLSAAAARTENTHRVAAAARARIVQGPLLDALAAQGMQGGLAVVGGQGAEAGLLEVGADGPHQLPLVVHHEHAGRAWLIHSAGPRWA